MPDLDICRERILSEDYRDFIVSELQVSMFETIPREELCEQQMEFIYRVVYVNREEADPIRLDRYSYNSIPKCFTLIDTQSMNQAGILQVQNYPTLQLMGENVMIGFLDTGIDYQNPIFRQLDGSTRIAGIWDQTIQEGEPPEGFLYGTEYRRETIDEALQSEEPLRIVPSTDTDSHGTFLVSVAAGGADVENGFLGAAPEATLAVVKLKPAKQYLKDFYLIDTQEPCYQENDIMLGVQYLNQLAAQYDMPLVICIALGTNQGSHSAISPLTGILDIYSNVANRAIVIGAGNEANQRHHYLGQMRNVNDVQEVEVRVDNDIRGFCLELWTTIPNIVAVSVTSPSGEQMPRVPLRRGVTEGYRFLFEGTVVSVDYKLLLENSNAELVFFRVEAPTAGIWKFVVEPIQVAEGIFHMWLPVTEFMSGEVFFLESNPDYTITEPGSTISAMTVGFYNGDENSVAINSGRGYTRSNRVKPDFVAPGIDVTGAIGRNQFTQRSGSSIGAGIAAGAAALLMEWVADNFEGEEITSIQIRNLLILGTEQIANTMYPNREWGYGRMNLYHTFEEIRKL